MDGGADDFEGRALQTADTFSCYISLEIKFGCHSRQPFPPGSGKPSGLAGVSCKKMRVIHTEGIFFSPCFSFVFTFLFQMLGTKYKHELLVDHPFADPAGSCGNFLHVVCHYALLFIKKWLVNWRLATVCFENPPTKTLDLPPNLCETLSALPRSYTIQY